MLSIGLHESRPVSFRCWLATLCQGTQPGYDVSCKQLLLLVGLLLLIQFLPQLFHVRELYGYIAYQLIVTSDAPSVVIAER